MSKAKELKELRGKINSSHPIHKDFITINPNVISMDEYFATLMSDAEIEKSIKNYGANFDIVRNEFKEKTKLQSFDYAFLFTAIALQCVRQYILTPFEERQSADKGSKIMEEKYGNANKMTGQYYYAPEKTIVSQKKVPFDVVAGSKKFALGVDGKGFDGNSHRFRTLGHDPILGYVFGTANIMTNTMTAFNGTSYHIKYAPNSAGISVPTIYANAQTSKVFSKVSERIKQDGGIRILIESIVKEHLHLKSDKTTDGLPIPFLSLISPDFSQTLAQVGLDAVRLGEIGEQAAFSILINTIISIIHSLLCGINGELDKELYKIRTRKILLYSNLIASTSNVIYSALSEDYKRFDIGGLLVTLYRIHSDTKFIDKIKYEFINNELSGIYKNKFEEYSFYYQ